MQKIVAEIHLANIRYNARLFKERCNTRLCAVVKANAYGHGAEEVTLALSDIADCFAVALVDEGMQIRQAACGKDILVFAPPITEEEAYTLIVNGFIVSLSDLWTAKLLTRVCKRYRLTARAHIKVNTGMNRYGVDPYKLEGLCQFLAENPYIRVEGVYSHLYREDEHTARRQRDIFLQAQSLCKRYFSSFISHLSATYGATLGEDFSLDMVRIGLGLYGYSPIPLTLKKGMSVRAQVVGNRRCVWGGVGYGEKIARKGERIFLLRGGYADGFLRKARNGADGYEQNANNLCMDVCLRKGNEKRGAWISLLTDAAQTARLMDTIPYEVLCAATRRAELVYDYEEC